MSYTLPDLPYAYNALEPYIDAQTMQIHHDKHHKAYVDKVNDTLKESEWADKPIEEVLRSLDQLPEAIKTKVRNNGGGHYNHSLFWTLMKPVDERPPAGRQGGEPSGELAEAISLTFGSFDEFKKQFTETAANHFGSGWAWLALDENHLLHLHGLPNQDSPVMHGHKPILGLDVWEHAYYLKYLNKRPDYIEAWWNVVNWDKTNELYAAAK